MHEETKIQNYKSTLVGIFRPLKIDEKNEINMNAMLFFINLFDYLTLG